jgi:hypothetical protein
MLNFMTLGFEKILPIRELKVFALTLYLCVHGEITHSTFVILR